MKELAGQDGGEPKKNEKKQPEKPSSGERKDGKKPEKRAEAQAAEKPEKPGENGREQLLRMLDDEERSIRRGIRRRSAPPPAVRDW